MKNILVVEDEKDLNKMLCDYLKTLDYTTESCFDGFSTLEKIKEKSFDLIILDIMLPGIDGFDVLKNIRKKSSIPIIILTAKVEENDKILGLEYGADDYMTKPFSLRELAARIKTITRRVSSVGKKSYEPTITYNEITLEQDKKNLYINGELKKITAIQFKIFEALLKKPGVVFSREELIKITGETDNIRNIDAHIKNLRKIISKDNNEKDFIETVRGSGYKFKENF